MLGSRLPAAALKRNLESAWDAVKAKKPVDLRAELRAREEFLTNQVASGQFSSVQANGRVSEWSRSGPGSATTVETADMWRDLLELYGKSRKFLKWCAKWGLDAFTAEAEDLSEPDTEAPAVTVANDQWAELQDEFFGDSVDDWPIVGEPVDDSTIFLWMMHLLAEPVSEMGSDRTALRTMRGGYGGGPAW